MASWPPGELRLSPQEAADSNAAAAADRSKLLVGAFPILSLGRALPIGDDRISTRRSTLPYNIAILLLRSIAIDWKWNEDGMNINISGGKGREEKWARKWREEYVCVCLRLPHRQADRQIILLRSYVRRRSPAWESVNPRQNPSVRPAITRLFRSETIERAEVDYARTGCQKDQSQWLARHAVEWAVATQRSGCSSQSITHYSLIEPITVPLHTIQQWLLLLVPHQWRH